MTPWALSPLAVLSEVRATTKGLDSATAATRLREFGPNELPAAPREHWLARLWRHSKDVLVLLLLVAAVVKAVMRDWVDFAVIVLVAGINIAVGMVQEGKAERALEAIRGMLSVRAAVLRDGLWADLDASALVPGDVIRVRPGDRVPADARLLTATSLQVEESALTGESVAATKSVAAVPVDSGLGDRTSMLYSSTLVVAGSGTAVVTATGAQTEIGHIQQMVAGADDLATPLARTMNSFGKTLAIIIMALAALMLAIGGLVHHWGISQLTSSTIAFAVAAIPEGLPAMVTITLALGVQAMARRRAISRHMTSVETLGSVSTICSDKTGTLTLNEMTVREAVTRRATYQITGEGYAPEGAVREVGGGVVLPSTQGVRDLRALAQTMALCNDAEITYANGQWSLVGEPTEGAVLAFGRKACDINPDSKLNPAGWTRVAELPFDSAHKYMVTLSEAPDGDRWLLVKGAWDAVAARCDTELGADGDSLTPLDADFWGAENRALGAQGLRVLAAARWDVPDDVADLPPEGPTGLTMVGLVGIVDPPRPEAIRAISEARNAGIGVSMITGDHADTASAIAQEMGLVDSPNAPVLTGAQLEEMDDEQLRAVVQGVHVYARTSPEHKIRIVRALQSHGEVVAMTGDGVNDAPALKQADVGVAMGIKGTAATKEAADVVLADDNFATIQRAVAEGRRIYDNIQKAVLFLLPTNGSQGLGLLVATLFGWAALPLQPVQVLWINMVTAVTLALPLATEPAEPGLLSRAPRDPNRPLLSAAMLRRVLLASVLIGGATIAVFFFEHQLMGRSLIHSQSVAVTMLTLGQTAYLFNCRFLDRSSITPKVFHGNRALWYAVAAMIGLHLLLIYTPFMQHIFRVSGISTREWGITLGLSLVIFLIIEAAKAIYRLRHPQKAVRRA